MFFDRMRPMHALFMVSSFILVYAIACLRSRSVRAQITVVTNFESHLVIVGPKHRDRSLDSLACIPKGKGAAEDGKTALAIA